MIANGRKVTAGDWSIQRSEVPSADLVICITEVALRYFRRSDKRQPSVSDDWCHHRPTSAQQEVGVAGWVASGLYKLV